jgi:hypothetical protein
VSLQQSQDDHMREMLTSIDLVRGIVRSYPDRELETALHKLVRAGIRVARRYAALTERKPGAVDERLDSIEFAKGH